jgi:hypothetical protein
VDLNHAPPPWQGVGLAVLGSGTVPLTCCPALGDPKNGQDLRIRFVDERAVLIW